MTSGSTEMRRESTKGTRGSWSSINFIIPTFVTQSYASSISPRVVHRDARRGEVDASAVNFCTTHFSAPERAGFATWLTSDLRARPRRERLRNPAISARDAEAESKSLPFASALSRRERQCRAKSTSPFVHFPDPARVLSLPSFIPPHLFALTREAAVPFKTIARSAGDISPLVKKKDKLHRQDRKSAIARKWEMRKIAGVCKRQGYFCTAFESFNIPKKRDLLRMNKR